MLSTAWRAITRDKFDQKLLPDLTENIKKIISKYDPVDLDKNFFELPDDFEEMVAKLFRDRTIQLLVGGHRSTWRKSLESIFKLLNSVHLRWEKDEYIIVLETVSTSEDYHLLNVFQPLLKNWTEKSESIRDDRIAQICIQWYENLMNGISSNSIAHEGHIIAVFEKLSSVRSIINEQAILDKLMDITFNHIRQTSEKLIFNVTTKVVEFDSMAKRVFTKVIKEKIDSMVLDLDEILLKKMRVICGCTGKNLKIPNE